MTDELRNKLLAIRAEGYARVYAKCAGHSNADADGKAFLEAFDGHFDTKEPDLPSCPACGGSGWVAQPEGDITIICPSCHPVGKR